VDYIETAVVANRMLDGFYVKVERSCQDVGKRLRLLRAQVGNHVRIQQAGSTHRGAHIQPVFYSKPEYNPESNFG
jgi:hypothetical protein